jgi:hypothetical protein
MAKGGGAGTRARAKGETHAAPTAPGAPFSGHDKLTPQQLDAVRAYQEGGNASLNEYYRGLKASPGYMGEHAGPLDKAIERSRIDHDVTLFRGWTQKGLAANPDALVGATIRDPAYFSTSTSKEVARKFHGSLDGVFLRLKAPKGTRGLHVHDVATGHSKYGAGGSDPEHEVLLGRGTSYRITRARRARSGLLVLDAVLVPGK